MKTEEVSISIVREVKESRRTEKKKSRRKQSPDGELGKVKDLSKILAHGEILSGVKEVVYEEEERARLFGGEEKFESSEWKGELDGPSEV